jgi:hypothetical protein
LDNYPTPQQQQQQQLQLFSRKEEETLRALFYFNATAAGIMAGGCPLQYLLAPIFCGSESAAPSPIPGRPTEFIKLCYKCEKEEL